MKEKLLGHWVEIQLTTGNTWTGRIEEWDEDALFISNGFEFGHTDHKGAECTNGEIKDIAPTESREFSLK